MSPLIPISLVSASKFPSCLNFLCLRRFLNSIKGISSSSSDVFLSCLYFLANFAKVTLSTESDSFSVSTEKVVVVLHMQRPLTFYYFQIWKFASHPHLLTLNLQHKLYLKNHLIDF